MALSMAAMQKCFSQGICNQERVPSSSLGESGRRSLVVSLRNKLANRLIGLCERRLIRQEHDAEVASPGLLAEAGTVDHEHMLVATQLLDEDVVAFGDVDAGESVERTPGRYAAQARRSIAPR